MPFFDEGFGLSESLATGSASNVFRPSPSSKRTSKTHGKSRAANKLHFPGIARHGEQAAQSLQIATPNAHLLETGEDKPKSRRQLRKDRKEKEWREKQALRNAERQKKGHTKAQHNDEHRKPEALEREDEEVEFLRRKRQREREAVGSGAGHQANGKKRRKTEDKDRGETAKSNNAFPLLNGEKVPKVLAPAERTGLNPQGLIPHDKGRTSLQEQRQQLPIWPYREALRQCLRDRDVLVMLGQTGSGKSTQIGQFLIDESWMERQRQRVGVKVVALGGCIAITQPRRVAAINLAKRVAQEMNTRLGEDVGYSVRFDNATSGKTRIKFLTDGMLLQEMLADPLLKRYSCIVVDEAHERTVGTDLVMGFLRKLVYGERRGNLKVVVMSATIQVEAMARFFEQNRGEGLLPLEAAIDASMDASEEKNKGQSNQIQDNTTLPDEGRSGQQPQLHGDTGDTKKPKKKKKNHRKNVHYNPEDLIRTPSPVPQRIPTPEVERNGEAVIYTEQETRVIPYFGSVALFEVPGRQFPVEIHHTAAPVEDFVDAALRSVFQIHYAEPLPGDILVFLTGQEEIESLQKLIEEATREMKDVPQVSFHSRSFIQLCVSLTVFRSRSFPYTQLFPFIYKTKSSSRSLQRTPAKSFCRPTSPRRP
jgi:ATP-dependent RNA helicase DHR2